MENMHLIEICNCINGELKGLCEDFLVSGISTDSRTIEAGDLFLAIIGNTYNGHDYIDLAIQKGASAVIVSNNYTHTSVPIIKVFDTLTALCDLASYYRNKFNIPFIAITGSSGKTSTKDMLVSILSSKYKVFGTEKNFNNHIGVPMSILKINHQHEVAVLELGMNHAGEISLLSKMVKPQIAIITNIGTAHIKYLKSRENILKAKLEIIDGLEKDGVLVINSDDDLLFNYLMDSTINTIGVGIKSKDKIKLQAFDVKTMDNGIVFNILFDGLMIDFAMPIIGEHNVNNALLAIFCSTRLGVPIESIKTSLKNYCGSSMRSEQFIFNGVTIIKDYYNANPESVKAAIKTLATTNAIGKKIAVLGQISELGDYSGQAHFDVGLSCRENNIDFSIFIGDSYEDFKRGCGDGCEVFNNRQNMLSFLEDFVKFNINRTDDVILIKGSREMKMEEVFEQLKKYLNTGRDDRFMRLPSTSTKLYVDISAMKHNIAQIKKHISNDTEIMPIVKANAYGCGVDIVVNIFGGCKYLAVADAKEAVILKSIFPKSSIVILYQPSFSDIDSIIENDFIVSVCNYDFICALNSRAYISKKIMKIHIEVDTGAGRLGISPEQCADFAKNIKCLKNIMIQGIFTHYACADSEEVEDIAYTDSQTDLFIEAVDKIESIYGKVEYKHIGGGAAAFSGRNTHFNMIRPGYMLYGYYPSKHLKIDLKPALKLASEIIFIKTVSKGTSISYNRTYVTRRDSVIATVAIGYMDGLSRFMSNKGFFVVNGQKAPIVGVVCMDLTMIDITDVQGDVNVGDEVAIFDNVNVTIDDIANICNTIGYEVISRIEDKAERIEQF